MADYLLIVDDDEDDVFFLTRALKPFPLPAIIDVASDGQEALKRLDRLAAAGDEVRLIILDLKMPRVNGIDVLRSIRASAEHSRIPVIILSASDEPGDHQAADQLGVDDFLRKPHNTDEYVEIALKICESFPECRTMREGGLGRPDAGPRPPEQDRPGDRPGV